MSPPTATTLQVGMNQSPIIFLQDALMQDWEGSALTLATTAELKFQEGKNQLQELQTNEKEEMERLQGRRRNQSPCELALTSTRKEGDREEGNRREIT